MFRRESKVAPQESHSQTLSERFKLNHNLALEEYDAECFRVATAARDFIVGNYALNGRSNDKCLLSFIDFCNAIIRAGHLNGAYVWDDALAELDEYLKLH